MILYYVVSGSVLLVYAAQILSGVILVWSLIRIRKFHKAHPEAGQELNTKTLAIHAAAFGLFIVSVVIYTVFYLHYFVEIVTVHGR